VSDLYRYFESGRDEGIRQERERTVKWMEQFIPDGHLEHEECDDCFVIRSIIAWLKEE